MLHDLRVRRFSLSDLGRIAEIERASFTIDAFSEATFRRWFKRCPDLFVVAEASGVIAGYMITCIILEKGDIVSIAVDPLQRRRGIGRALVDYTMGQLRSSGVIEVTLEVRTTNAEGIRLWHGSGFVPIGTIPHFYRDGAAALRMKRLLGQGE